VNIDFWFKMVILMLTKTGKHKFASIIEQKSSTIQNLRENDMLIVQQLLNIYMIY